MDVRRCSLGVDETVKAFLDYYQRREVFGLFLSSGVLGSADATMDRLNGVARILRKKHRFKGYIHLKIIPGASNAAIEETVSLADAVSVNIETPGEKNLAKLSQKKRYIQDIIEPMKIVRSLTAPGSKYAGVKQTTQFIVGAAGEPDAEIVKYMFGLYERMKIHRVYFSAYQKGLGDDCIEGESARRMADKSATGGSGGMPTDILMREHRLYQVDFLLRKYGFAESDIVFEKDGNLSLAVDPKETWAMRHPEMYPVNVNTASRQALLRVPGIGLVTVKRILQQRKQERLGSIEDVGKAVRPRHACRARVGVRWEKARKYLVF